MERYGSNRGDQYGPRVDLMDRGFTSPDLSYEQRTSSSESSYLRMRRNPVMDISSKLERVSYNSPTITNGDYEELNPKKDVLGRIPVLRSKDNVI